MRAAFVLSPGCRLLRRRCIMRHTGRDNTDSAPLPGAPPLTEDASPSDALQRLPAGTRAFPDVPAAGRTKSILRDQAKAARFGLTPAEIAERSSAVCKTLLALIRPFCTVMVYASKPPEVDTGELIVRLLAEGKRVVVPIIERETCSLRLSYLEDPSVLLPSTFDVPEPIGSEIPALPEDVEAAVIPMLAFDRFGNRLGYGAGYYDRFLLQNPHIVKIGIAFACQQAECLPAESNDINMDCIVTENGIITCR